MSENFIEIQNLEKVYANNAKAVYDFNLNIKKKEFIVIVGPSGCGKSTTLRMIAGLEDITSGNLIIDGELANYKLSKDRNMAIVFQSYALYPQMNVFENIAFPLTINKYKFPVVNRTILSLKEAIEILNKKESIATLKNAYNKKLTGLDSKTFIRKTFVVSEEAANLLNKLHLDKVDDGEIDNVINNTIKNYETQLQIENEKLSNSGSKLNEKCEYLDNEGQVIFEYRKMTKSEIDDKVNKTAKILDLGDYLDRLPKQLSGGQMQRVALGRAIVKDAPIFLMDEPLSNLDAKLRLTMRSEIVSLHNKINATTIYVTHDQTEAMTMADRIVVMSKGFIQQIDEPSVIYDDPCNLFVAKFIGAPSINVIKGEVKSNKIYLNDEVNFSINEEMVDKISNFYKEKYLEFSKRLEDFEKNNESRTFIKKVLSANSRELTPEKNNSKKSIFGLKKAEQYSLENDKDYLALKEMTESLQKYSECPSELVLAIRPEKLDIVPNSETKKSKTGYLAHPEVVELLGDEYQIHFDFLGNRLVAKFAAKIKIDKNQDFLLNFSEKDFLFFDPVTGERIK